MTSRTEMRISSPAEALGYTGQHAGISKQKFTLLSLFVRAWPLFRPKGNAYQ